MTEISKLEWQAEVDRNYEAFKKLLPSIVASKRNKYALMQAGEVVNYFDSANDARQTAVQFLKGKPYSIQQVTDSAIDLGFFSHAVDSRPISSSNGPVTTAGHSQDHV